MLVSLGKLNRRTPDSALTLDQAETNEATKIKVHRIKLKHLTHVGLRVKLFRSWIRVLSSSSISEPTRRAAWHKCRLVEKNRNYKKTGRETCYKIPPSKFRSARIKYLNVFKKIFIAKRQVFLLLLLYHSYTAATLNLQLVWIWQIRQYL